MNFILDGEDIKLENKYKVCVLIHLYYEDTIHEYEKYIKETKRDKTNICPFLV